MKPGKFKGRFDFRWLDRDWWLTLATFSYTTAAGEIYKVNKGFYTDGGSVPRLLTNILHRTEFLPAYTLHDWLYMTGACSRAEADRILMEAISTLSIGGDHLKRWVIWAGVRLGGWAPWGRYRAAQAGVGRKRQPRRYERQSPM